MTADHGSGSARSDIATGHFIALSHEFGVIAGAEIVLSIERLFSSLRAEGSSTTFYRVAETSNDRVRLTYEGELVVEGVTADIALKWLEWDVNRRAVVASGEEVVLHAACAEARGRAVVIAGDSGAGKTTLVGALMDLGLRYVTDEAVAIDAHGMIRPYPKPLSVKQDDRGGPQLVPPAPATVTDRRRVAPALIVFPARRPAAEPALIPISKGQAIVTLGQHAFNLGRAGREGLERLRQIALRAPAYRAEYDEAWSVARLISANLEDSDSRS